MQRATSKLPPALIWSTSDSLCETAETSLCSVEGEDAYISCLVVEEGTGGVRENPLSTSEVFKKTSSKNCVWVTFQRNKTTTLASIFVLIPLPSTLRRRVEKLTQTSSLNPSSGKRSEDIKWRTENDYIHSKIFEKLPSAFFLWCQD